MLDTYILYQVFLYNNATNITSITNYIYSSQITTNEKLRTGCRFGLTSHTAIVWVYAVLV